MGGGGGEWGGESGREVRLSSILTLSLHFTPSPFSPQKRPLGLPSHPRPLPTPHHPPADFRDVHGPARTSTRATWALKFNLYTDRASALLSRADTTRIPAARAPKLYNPPPQNTSTRSHGGGGERSLSEDMCVHTGGALRQCAAACAELAHRAASAVWMRAMAVAVLLPPTAPFARGHVDHEPAVAAPPLLGVDVG